LAYPPPWGYRVGEAGELVPIQEQQAAIRRMRKLRGQGLALRTIAAKMKAAGVSISHAGVKNALAARDRQPAPGMRTPSRSPMPSVIARPDLRASRRPAD